MDTYKIYVVEGYETYDKKTNTYTDVKRIEVIADTEKEAYDKARTLLKAKHYKTWSVFEKVMPGDFTAEEKKTLVRSYGEMANFYHKQNNPIIEIPTKNKMRTVKVCENCRTKPSMAQCMVCGMELCKYHVKRSGEDAMCLEHYNLTRNRRGVAKIL